MLDGVGCAVSLVVGVGLGGGDDIGAVGRGVLTGVDGAAVGRSDVGGTVLGVGAGLRTPALLGWLRAGAACRDTVGDTAGGGVGEVPAVDGPDPPPAPAINEPTPRPAPIARPPAAPASSSACRVKGMCMSLPGAYRAPLLPVERSAKHRCVGRARRLS